jgi:uncharacterized membrane protein YbjE (DUF340 family)
MFSEGGYVMIFGVLLGMSFIAGSIYFISRILVSESQEILVKFILLIFTALVALFIVDKVIAFKIKLLADEQNSQLFDLIKTLVLMVFSYYFGIKSNELKSNQKDEQ